MAQHFPMSICSGGQNFLTLYHVYYATRQQRPMVMENVSKTSSSSATTTTQIPEKFEPLTCDCCTSPGVTSLMLEYSASSCVICNKKGQPNFTTERGIVTYYYSYYTAMLCQVHLLFINDKFVCCIALTWMM